MVSGEEDGTQRINVEVSLTIDHEGLADFSTAVVTSWQVTSICTMPVVSPDSYTRFAVSKSYMYLRYGDDNRGTGFTCLMVSNFVCGSEEDGLLYWYDDPICGYLPAGTEANVVCVLKTGTPSIALFKYEDGDLAGGGDPYDTITLTGHSFSGETVEDLCTSPTHFWVLIDGDTLYGFKVADGALQYTHDFATADGTLLAYNSVTDRLMVFDKTTNTIYEIDPTSGGVVTSAAAAAVPDGALTMDMNPYTNVLYYAVDDEIYSLTKAEGGILNVDDDASQVILTVLQTALNTPATGSSGKNADIDTSSEVLVGSATACRMVQVTAHPDNTGRLWLGFGTAVVDEGAYLDAGDSITISIDDANDIAVIASVANQKACWLTIT